ncbi:MAG: HEAT repeat domain-containing protein [Candidatus Brocadiae bacterium]|nr:HEAT repeat domain-containing protein [Candidatus Brocadiia bacterium]
MKQICFLFQHWFGWICLVFLIRLCVYCTTTDIKKPQEIAMERILSGALESKDKEFYSLAFQSLYELAKKSPKDRLFLESLLEQKLSHSKSINPEAKAFFIHFQEDPYLVFKKASEQLSSFGLQDFLILSFSLSLAFSLLIVFAIPCFFLFFWGAKSLHKVFGKHGIKIFLLIDFLFFTWIVYFCFFQKSLLLCQSGMIVCLFIVLLCMSKSGTLSLFWEGNPKSLQKALIVFYCLIACSFLPYMVSAKEKKEIEEKALLSAIEKSIEQSRKDLLPLIEGILSKSHALPVSVKISLLKAIGELGTEKNLNTLFLFLHNHDVNIQKAALESINKIAKK